MNAAFTAAFKKKILAVRFLFENLLDDDGAVRQGFFGTIDFAALVVELPGDIADLVRFRRMTGWRCGEGIGLMWAQGEFIPWVDWDDAGFPGTHDEPVPGPNAGVRLSRAPTKGCAAPLARAFIDVGVGEGRIMQLFGWKTRDMFDRYDITSQDDLNKPVAQRVNGEQTANKRQTNGEQTANREPNAEQIG